MGLSHAPSSTGLVLLRLVVAIEPDFLRLSRFALEAARVCQGNVFTAASALTQALPRMRACREDGDVLEVLIVARGHHLILAFADDQVSLCAIDESCTETFLRDLATHLRERSDHRDADLLLQQNRAAARHAAHQAEVLASLEQNLIERRRELSAVTQQAETDVLTGLWNRRSYDARLVEAVRMASVAQPLALIFIDLDNFKAVNDREGHAQGDAYLQRIGQILHGATRAGTDSACRIGGDEFAILVPAGLAVADRIATQVIEATGARVSVGISGWREGDTPATLAGRADAALYAAKRAGRGRVMIES
ncbi:MAG: GGDEF domain-containing protein [Acidiferrobacter sp.]